jgi:hypothetical protein
LLQAGAEQEWKLGKLNMETAGKGMYSASSQLSAVSVKAKSALGLSSPTYTEIVGLLLSSNVGICKIYFLLSLWNNAVCIFSQLICRTLL